MALISWIGLLVLIGCGVGMILLAWKINLRWRLGLFIRLILLIVIGMAFYAAILVDQPIEFRPEVLILDRSDSISEKELFNSQVSATVWKNLRPNRHVIIFGSSSDVVLSSSWLDVGRNASDLNEALKSVKTLFGESLSRIIVATDGMVDDPEEVETWIDRFQQSGTKVDLISQSGVDFSSDAYVGQIRGVTRVWSGTQFPIILPVVAKEEGQAILQIIVNGAMHKEYPVELEAGSSSLVFRLQAGSPGVMHVEARLIMVGDEFYGNNSAYTSIRVFAQPSILFITKNEPIAARLVQNLQEEGSGVSVISPELFSTTIEELDKYQVIMVHDILAQDFNYEQMQAIKIHVLEKGKGLIFLGGRNSFTLGGYQNTILEPIIPVRLAPPDRVQRVPITFLLVLDRSGSMAGDRDTDIAPIDLTREAAMRAIETLRSDDYLGVLTFSATPNWDVEIRRVGEGLELRTAQDKVSQIVASGTTYMYQALEQAIEQMVSIESTDYPHILLMTDGVSGDGSRDEFVRLVQTARENGITISTIGLGRESDPVTLAEIAEVGGGRFYQVYDPIDLPEVMISESRAVQAENVQEGRTNLILGEENHPILAGFSLDELPILFGYTATQSKSDFGAENVLISGNFGDPVLSVWQVGLGQVAAWMGDLGEQWNPDMQTWENQGIFWQQVARYTLPDPSIGTADVMINQENDRMTVMLIFNEGQIVQTNMDPSWIEVSSGQKAKSFQMSQVSSSSFSVDLPKPEPGAYTGIIRYTENGDGKEILVPFAINYPDEWRFADQNVGENRIKFWLEKTGGEELNFELELENSMEQEATRGKNWFDILMFLTVISWLFEIAIRRWRMPWRNP